MDNIVNSLKSMTDEQLLDLHIAVTQERHAREITKRSLYYQENPNKGFPTKKGK